jgi:hypothetical protein
MSPFWSLEFGRDFVMVGKLVDPCGRLQTLLPLSVISALRLRLHMGRTLRNGTRNPREEFERKEPNGYASNCILVQDATNTPEN